MIKVQTNNYTHFIYITPNIPNICIHLIYQIYTHSNVIFNMQVINDEPFNLSYMVYDPNPDVYEAQLHMKIQKVEDLFKTDERTKLENIETTTFRSPAEHCRFRCRFAIVREDSKTDEGLSTTYLSYAKYDHGEQSVMVTSFPIAALPIYRVMPLLLKHILIVDNGSDVMIGGLRGVNFLCPISGHLMMTLIYADRVLNEEWLESANALQKLLEIHMKTHGSCSNSNTNTPNDNTNTTTSDNDSDSKIKINLVGRSKGIKLVVGEDYLVECFSMSDGDVVTAPYQQTDLVYYKQIENGFSNPNAYVNISSLKWLSKNVISIVADIHRIRGLAAGAVAVAVDSVSTGGVDLLELYCGNGNHTAILSRYVSRMLAVESNSFLCEVARDNMRMNGVENVEILHCTSEYVARSLVGIYRKSNHEKLRLGIDTEGAVDEGHCYYQSKAAPFHNYKFEIILVDPPRAGLAGDKKDADVAGKAVCRYNYILYISCNPVALHKDLLYVSTVCC